MLAMDRTQPRAPNNVPDLGGNPGEKRSYMSILVNANKQDTDTDIDCINYMSEQ